MALIFTTLFWGNTQNIIQSVLFMSGLKSQMLQIEVKIFKFFTSFGILNGAYGTKCLPSLTDLQLISGWFDFYLTLEDINWLKVNSGSY